VRPQDAADELWPNYLNLLMNGDDQTPGLREKLNRPAPKKPGYDLCEALSLAARQTPHNIIIAGSGLTETGALDFTQGNLLLSDDEQIALIAEKLVAGVYIPDLTGVDIAWYGLGEVSGDQEPLPAKTLTVLEDLWYEILMETGANSVEFYPANAEDSADFSAYPEVKPVEIPLDMDDLKEVYEYEVPEIVQPVHLNDERLNFVADQDEFINPTEADAALAPYALGLIKSGQRVYILGMTAITQDGVVGLNQLSLDRAVRIKNALVTLGVPESQIGCVGTGSLPNVFRTEPDTIGSVVNRAAVLVDANDDRIRDILSGTPEEDYYENW
jgi:outer membrane protein OmpA-like peptidoglycan-associated protein